MSDPRQDAPSRTIRHPWGATDAVRLRAALQSGTVMTYPTETAYALGGNALLPQVAAAVYALKGRARAKALLVLIDGTDGLDGWTREITPAAKALMARCWPGPLTLVFAAGPAAPPHLPDARGTIALRWSPHPVIEALLRLGGVPLIGTSANPSGMPSLHSADAVHGAFPGAFPGASAGGIGLAVDGGPTSGGAPSTVVDTTVHPPRIVREGVLSRAALQAALGGLALA